MANTAYLVTPALMASMLDDPTVRIIDCRFELLDPDAGRRSYEEAHIPGAVYADLDKDLAGPVGPDTGRHPLPDASRLANTFADMGVGNDSRVVVYDEGSGAVAARAWWLLRWLGHDNAAVLDGGFAAWRAAAYATDKAMAGVGRGNFVAAPRNELVLETAEIVALGDRVKDLRLVDARAAERFSGLEEPIDTVAGHIPGSCNLPFSENVDECGRWRSPEAIRASLSRVLGEPRGQSWAVMCGSGVTACHLVIGGLLAGYREPRVYVGSWSEWITDPARQVARGPR